ncbi:MULTISPECIES: MFS transporter [Francisella]|uniref:MFS transporter n=1 Tax=Francisella opportunistica TaxID=2016517 RepID=A0A345JP86_9GAMM|nr:MULTISPECIES: MFS transporter [Francisella]APC90791.1 L-Proline/Glycine betaine transporter ProP [Francisella sp. MA067296]AXH29132.1 MFS transporter [Francisella opportunistica]AXH30784.1 MFS transporter [Francisella opportunistica]AXH32429.1 MFS transporter [Francisella opportunistica]
MKKLLVLIASSAEWYEFTVYSFCAGYIGAAFFPGDPFVKFLAAFGAFAAGFLARPLGGIIFGYIGDKKSRSTALALAAFFMGVPTVGMALLPSYAAIGILAPLLLVAFRILQGIAIGGQYSGSVVILVEAESMLYAKAKAGVNVITSAFGGILLAIVTFQIIRYFIPNQAMVNGGWRILFGIAIILVVLSFFIKHSGDEKKPQKSDISLTKIIFKNYKSLVYMILLCFPGAVVAYFQITILPNIIKQILKQLDVNVAILTTISIIMFIITCNIAARLTKYFKIKTITAFGLVLMVVLSLPMYALYKANNDLLIVFFVVMGAIFGIFYGNIMLLFTECLPKEIRYTGFALAYNIGFGVFGGLLPFLCFFLAKAVSDYMAVGMIAISAIVGLITLYKFEPENLKNSLINSK